MKTDRINAVLKAVCALGKPGESVIIDRAELQSSISGDCTPKELEDTMRELAGMEYISLRYSDNSVFCYSVLDKGRTLCQKIVEREERREEERRRAEERARAQREAEKAELAKEKAEEKTKKDERQEPETEHTETQEEKPTKKKPREKKVREEEPKAVPAPQSISPAKLFLLLAGASALGGIVSGVIVFILSKIL